MHRTMTGLLKPLVHTKKERRNIFWAASGAKKKYIFDRQIT
jgi:hypothetical protein